MKFKSFRKAEQEDIKKEMRNTIFPKLTSLIKQKFNPNNYQSVGTLPIISASCGTTIYITNRELRKFENTPEQQNFEEKSQIENIRTLEHWNIDKTHRLHLSASQKTLLVSNTLNSLENDTESVILSMGKEQLKFYKELNMREQFKKAVKPKNRNSLLRKNAIIGSLYNNEKSNISEFSIKIDEIEKELALEIQRINLRKKLEQNKIEIKKIITENKILNEKIKSANDELTTILKQPVKSRKNTLISDLGSGKQSKKEKSPTKFVDPNTKEGFSNLLAEMKINEKRDDTIKNLSEKIAKMKALYDKNIENIKKQEKQISGHKIELQICVKSQLEYYYNLLKKGQENRNQGLVWIIKAIIQLEGIHPIFIKYPKYIDTYTYESLNKIAEIEMEIEKIFDEKKKINPNNEQNLTIITSSPERIVSKNSFAKHVAHRKNPEQAFEIHEQKTELDKQILNYQKIVREIRNQEILRLSKTFLKEGILKSGKKKDFSMSLQALLGEYAGDKEYKKVMQKREEIIMNLDKYKSFVISKPSPVKTKINFNSVSQESSDK